MIASPVGFLERIANITVISTPISSINRNGPIGMPHCISALSILLRVQAAFEKFGGIEQIGKQNAIDQKTRAVAHENRQFPDLPSKGQRSARACRPKFVWQ